MIAVATTLFPVWRQVEKDLLDSGLTFGSLIADDVLKSGFGLKPATTIAQHEHNRLEFLRQLSALRESLLHNRNMMLVSEAGVGYKVVHPREQTRVAVDKRTREIKSAMKKMAAEVLHVERSMLTDAERRSNDDACARIAALQSIARKQLKIGGGGSK